MYKVPFVALAIGLALSVPASALSTLVESNVSGNDCSGVLGKFPTCSYDGADALIKLEPGDDKKGTEFNSSFGTLDGSEFEIEETGKGTGSFRYTPGEGDPILSYIAVKGGKGFNLFSITGFDGVAYSGEWFTPVKNVGQTSNKHYELSHMTFFGASVPVAPVPLPAGIVLMASALGALGIARGRRKAA
ncbi:VPLPA-CTERM sorting domain-containing protein [Tropicimonas sp. IMCC34043]|uniref:VPLPA-CTERM sorting domain-containing protein n=1 Tax=Tropicimonas sp. IMCC34043 TaxID=2248760 RepID=UPI000E2421E6|nr:VPLPA-CTERM sorting domain-containing protein [Tropicimonas sp. IMCC34043]